MVLVVLSLLVVGALVWRLNQGPLEIGFARKFIESELSDPSRHLSLQVGQLYLDWSFADSRPRIRMDHVRLTNTRNDQLVAGFDSARVTLSRTGLLRGQAEPRRIEIDRPVLTLVRGADHNIRLALQQAPSDGTVEKITPDLAAQSEEIFRILDLMATPSRDLPQGWPLRALNVIAINDARMMVEDHVLSRSWLVPKLEMSFRRTPGTVLARAALWFDGAETKPAQATLEFGYEGQDRSVSGALTLHQLSSAFLAEKFPDLDWLAGQDITLDGEAGLVLDPGLHLSGFSARLSSRNGALSLPDLYSAPLRYQSMVMEIGYDVSENLWSLDRGDIDFGDDFHIGLSAAVRTETDGENKRYAIPLNIAVHNLPQSAAAQFWPDLVDEPSAQDWVVNRLSGGRVYKSTIALELAARRDGETQGWSVEMERLKADFKIADMDVDYSAPLMKLENASGHGTYDYESDIMDITVESGMLGDMTIKSGRVLIETLVGPTIGTATIDAHMQGPLKTVFDYIAAEPIGVTDLPMDVKRIGGSADLKLTISMPTLADLPAEKVIVSGTGTARDVLLPGLVSGLDVTGGPAEVVVKDGRIDVKGQGRLSGRDMRFTFAQFFESKGKPFAAQAVAELNIDPALRTHFGVELNDWMEGSVPAKITYTELRGGRTEIEVEADATPAALMIGPMNYTKPPGQRASVRAKAILNNGDLIRVEGLSVETPHGRTDNAVLEFTGCGTETTLRKGTFPRARLHESDVAIEFDITADNTLNMGIKGSFLDARPFLENTKKDEEYKGPGLNASLKVTRARTAETRVINDVGVLVRMDKGGELNYLDMDGIAGRGKLTFRYRPHVQGTHRVLRIEAEDAGAALSAFDIYESAVGGRLLVVGQSAPGGDHRVVSGKMEMVDFRVVNAPVLARLVNALSLPGMIELLGSDGINFARLESDFVWEKKRGGDLITMSDGRTSGSSMGLTFDGTVDRVADTINITGTIVPVSLVNDLLGNIPILGQILSGGSRGGVFAATYSVRGPAKNPTTTVNPLAVLTPGFLRRIFFE